MKHSIRPHWFLVLGGLLLILAVIAISGSPPTLAQDPPPTETPNPVGNPPDFLRGIYDAWVQSPHADFTAEAFIHWNEDGAVPESCATCHSTPGYMDFLGADGSAVGIVDVPAALGTVVNCDACHNEVATNLTAVSFPSGVEITDLGDSARCMVCHQGRAWGGAVDQAVVDAGLTESLNTPSDQLRFINIHYYAAAASLYGADVHAGYEYPGETYQMQFLHVEEYDSCFECHNPHTLEVKVAECATCHEDVESVEDVRDIRMPGSLIDYDGDGDMEEGIYGEITTLQEMLYATMQEYSTQVVESTIFYNSQSYPYFFQDPNGDGELTEDEAIRDNGYAAFTPRLLQAAYNYQVSQKDPGNYVHNAKYHIELLYDSIYYLSMEIETATGAPAQTGMGQARRNDPGHFDSTGEPFRHWDEDGEVSATCAKCHTAEGLPFFLKNGVNIASEPSDSLMCKTCHNAIPDFTLYELNDVTFPSGLVVSFGEGKANNLCLNCHQGRESTISVNAAIARAGVGDDEVSEALNFRNPHYFAAGATLFGGEAQGAYQYEGMDYNGRLIHTRSADECNDCHNEHALTIRTDLCLDCHEDLESPEDYKLIRLDEDEDPVDYDGDGDVTEPIAAEIESLHTALFAVIQNYAANTIGTPIVYNASAYPYWYIDANGDGVQDEGDTERYTTWTPNLVRAAYNYQYVAKDPGAFTHNSEYVLQVLYDSLLSLGGEDAVANFTRAPVRE